MSDSSTESFGKFIPGFDFLQNLAKNATQAVPQIPNMASWIAPTLNEEELEKRIAELKAVHFWLDQNSKALGATVQALEVQKMTLATLKGMNLNIGEMANAFKFKTPDHAAANAQRAAEKAESAAKADAAEQAAAKKLEDAAKPATAPVGLVDPMHLWTSLTQQFQHIAAGAIKEASKTTAMDMGMNLAKEAVKATTQAVADVTAKKAPSAKAPAAKPAAKKTAPATATAAKKASPKTPASRS